MIFFFCKLILTKLDPYLSKTGFYERLIRIDHKFYHHTLKKNVNYKKTPSFYGSYTLCTDNFGFKYRCNQIRDKEFDIAFMGDSFVEVALDYEETFVGLYEKDKKISVANLGVTSYAPNIYLSKMKYLLDNNFKFKHVIVFIDISDLYDDNTFYKLNNDLSVSEKNAEKKRLKTRKFLRNNFPLTNYYFYVIKMMKRLNDKVPPLESLTPIFTAKETLKAKRTYHKDTKIEGNKNPIAKTQNEILSKLCNLLIVFNISFCVLDIRSLYSSILSSF